VRVKLSRGQALVEFSIVAAVLCLALFLLWQMQRLLYYRHALRYSAFFAARETALGRPYPLNTATDYLHSTTNLSITDGDLAIEVKRGGLTQRPTEWLGLDLTWRHDEKFLKIDARSSHKVVVPAW
jgi:hypothetical protein